jgi:AraC-like DNA-binding protein
VSVSSETQTIAREHSTRSYVSSNASESAASSRTCVLDSAVALVEDLRSPGIGLRRSKEQYSPEFQVCLPYRGLFVWHVGNDDVVGDANQVLFVAGGESFHLSQPCWTDYAELIITPNRAFLEEVADGAGVPLSIHPLFRRRSRRVGFDLQRLRARFLQEALAEDASGPALEECTVMLLRAALENEGESNPAGGATRRLIRRTKEFLQANLSGPVRLADVARAVGASPAYLTDVFRRIEGIPLHGYLTQLRLARALEELRDADDLTTLALSLGFSSHSHFSAAFRRAFDCTPSQFRDASRTKSPLARA